MKWGCVPFAMAGNVRKVSRDSWATVERLLARQSRIASRGKGRAAAESESEERAAINDREGRGRERPEGLTVAWRAVAGALCDYSGVQVVGSERLSAAVRWGVGRGVVGELRLARQRNWRREAATRQGVSG